LFLSREATAADCEQSGRRLHMSAGAVSVSVHRMRERYGVLLRETVAQTLVDLKELDEELRYLFTLLNETL
jgi:DNA-binding transcriptional LysR family regulator